MTVNQVFDYSWKWWWTKCSTTVENGSKRVNVCNWILTSCQPHRIIQGWYDYDCYLCWWVILSESALLYWNTHTIVVAQNGLPVMLVIITALKDLRHRPHPPSMPSSTKRGARQSLWASVLHCARNQLVGYYPAIRSTTSTYTRRRSSKLEGRRGIKLWFPNGAAVPTASFRKVNDGIVKRSTSSQKIVTSFSLIQSLEARVESKVTLCSLKEKWKQLS